MAPAAVLFFADMVLAAAIRAYVDPQQRTATLMLRLDFTGAPARGTLTAEGRSDGFSAHRAAGSHGHRLRARGRRRDDPHVRQLGSAADA